MNEGTNPLVEMLNLLSIELYDKTYAFSNPPYSYPKELIDELYDIFGRVEVLYFKVTKDIKGGFRYSDEKGEYANILLENLKRSYYEYIEKFDVTPDYLFIKKQLYDQLNVELAVDKIYRTYIDDVIIVEIDNSSGLVVCEKTHVDALRTFLNPLFFYL